MADRDRTVIEKQLRDLQKHGLLAYDRAKDELLIEVLLDIRDELRKILRTQGDAKWGPKI